MRFWVTEQRDSHGGYRHSHGVAAFLLLGCRVKLQIGVVRSGEISEY